MGDQTPAKRTDGQSSVELMNLMGYDAMALGEGDMAKLGLETLRQRIQEAKFAVLSANAVFSGSDQLIVQPFLLKEMNGHHIAIIGLTGWGQIKGVEILDPIESVQRVMAQLKGQADIIILLSHAGLQTNRQIIEAIPEIDLVISGGIETVTPSALPINGNRTITHALSIPTTTKPVKVRHMSFLRFYSPCSFSSKYGSPLTGSDRKSVV